jgi:hypothetical protein
MIFIDGGLLDAERDSLPLPLARMVAFATGAAGLFPLATPEA